jgi:hypothetical protein
MAGGVTKERIITLIKAGTPESEIKDLIRHEGLAYQSTATTQSEIREAGGDASLTAFIYNFNQEHGNAAESAVETKARETSSRRMDESVPRVFFGIHGGVSSPRGDLKDAVDGKTSATYGLHVDLPISAGALIRPRLDIANYSGRYAVLEAQFPGLTTASTIKTLWVGAELLLGQGAVQGGGWYFGVGLGVQNTSVKIDMVQVPVANVNDSKSALGTSVLLGYQFNTNIGTELRIAGSTPKIAVGNMSADFSAQAVSFGLTCRF